MFADVTSANVVGYQNLSTDPTGKGDIKRPNFGFTFQPIGDPEGWVSLGKVKMIGMDAYNGDYLYTLQPENTRPTDVAYAYYDRASVEQGLLDYWEPEQITEEMITSCIGWWDMVNGFSGDPNDKIDDVQVKVGTFFIGYIEGKQNIDVQCSGEVLNKEVPITYTGAKRPTFANPIPRQVALREITVTGLDAYNGEYFYTLQPENTRPTDRAWAYYDRASVEQGLLDYWEPEQITEEMITSCIGWWDMVNGFSGDPNDKIDNTLVNPGEAFVGYCDMNAESGATAVIAFPKGCN